VGRGFGSHSHRDMEIISYVLEGALAHKDSMGTDGVIRPGDVQRMSAGTGVVHSEQNASHTDEVHFLQIWLKPDTRGIAPGYDQKTYADAEKRGRLRLVASPDGRDGSLTINADAHVHAGIFDAGENHELALADGRHAWVQVAPRQGPGQRPGARHGRWRRHFRRAAASHRRHRQGRGPGVRSRIGRRAYVGRVPRADPAKGNHGHDRTISS
jgi:hypothetical protein